MRYKVLKIEEDVDFGCEERGEEFLSTDVLKLSDGTEIGISRMKRKEIQEAFADYSWRSTRRRMQGYR